LIVDDVDAPEAAPETAGGPTDAVGAAAGQARP
jgi:hypothetical protein